MLALGLRGTELFLYALIFRYSQMDLGCCFAKREILAKWCGVTSTRTIDAALQSLLDKGFIRKTKSVIFDKERICYSVVESAEIAPLKCAESAHQVSKNCAVESAEIAPNNKRINKTNTFTPPTPQEVAAYAKEVGYKDPEGFAAYYVTYQNAAGWVTGKDNTPINNWKLNVLAWRNNHKDEVFEKPGRTAAKRLTWEEYQKLND